jgi:erythromycin esterase-like protein
VVTDDMVEAVAVTAPLADLGAAIRERYGNRVQRVGYYTMLGGCPLSEAEWTSLIAATKG